MQDEPTPMIFMGDTHRVLRRLSMKIRWKIGRAIRFVQMGGTPTISAPLTGFSDPISEIRIRHDKEAYRAVYTVSLGDRVYLLHIFHKKSKKGISIPQQDIEIIRLRLKEAQAMEARRNEQFRTSP